MKSKLVIGQGVAIHGSRPKKRGGKYDDPGNWLVSDGSCLMGKRRVRWWPGAGGQPGQHVSDKEEAS